ncbi:MAG: ABC transporter permease [Alphaproteobacteria bacterium]|nr:ABC transporter permease [Alphaproteobacteria bacterium]
MTLVQIDPKDGAPAKPRRALSWSVRVSRIAAASDAAGLAFASPFVRLLAGENPQAQVAEIARTFIVPLLGIAVFVALWSLLAPTVQTSLGAIPGPYEVAHQAEALWQEHEAEREKEAVFYAKQAERNAELAAKGEAERVKWRDYTGKPTYIDQILTSLITVALGFAVATLIAVPLGIACGLSPLINGALNPLIQIFRPVSPLAWLPIVTMVVSALYVNASDALPKSLVISALTVTLCSLWPTLINTALGVSTIDRDLVNVGRVLQLSPLTTVMKVVLPSALPLIFTGLRLSLGVGWMVLIAAEMLAQNPGLGKFVWDEFQNGSSSSLARIIVAVLTIGLIGFLLDRLMYALQAAFTYSAKR